MNVGSLFSGIGGLDLGLEQAGMKTVWQVEFDDWARGKLDENFPHTEKFKDVRDVGKHNLRAVDIICGGFPCQDVSVVKQSREGLEGKRSGLWSEYFRIVCELRPRFVVIENVANLVVLGLDRVLSDLASLGFNAQWQTLRASDFGLPTARPRLFIIAYTGSQQSSMAEAIEREVYRARVSRQISQRQTTEYIEDLKCAYPAIPEYLRMDNGLSFELSEIEAAIKGYGNAVAPPVAKWIGERIIEFDRSVTHGVNTR